MTGDHLFDAKEAQKYYADADRNENKLNQGDWVMLKEKGVRAYQRANLPEKWRLRFLWPVEILEKIEDLFIESNFRSRCPHT